MAKQRINVMAFADNAVRVDITFDNLTGVVETVHIDNAAGGDAEAKFTHKTVTLLNRTLRLAAGDNNRRVALPAGFTMKQITDPETGEVAWAFDTFTLGGTGPEAL